MVEADGAEVVLPPFPASTVKQAVIGFDKDDEGHWRAKLACGHYQHVRHDPPLTVRKWTQTEEGRSSRIGQELECRKCGEGQAKDFYE